MSDTRYASAEPPTIPTVSVVIAAFADDRWEDLNSALESVKSQTRLPVEIVVVIDHNTALLERAVASLEGVIVTANASVRGASGARNTGVAMSRGEICLLYTSPSPRDRQ